MTDNSQQFREFIGQLKRTNHTLDTFCDFGKIERNVAEVKLSLCMLNSLVGARDLELAVDTIFQRDPRAFDALPILIAVRNSGTQQVIDNYGNSVKLKSMFTSTDSVMEFLTNTGLSAVLQERKITNLVDYVFGVETGLDSNGRKNRGGHAMEKVVQNLLADRHIAYKKEVSCDDYPEVMAALGSDKKRFDFAIYHGAVTYLTEVNFYNTGGSKLNEVARAYSELSPKINALNGLRFVWITDGQGWLAAKSKLREAFGTIDHIYNLTTFPRFLDSLNNK